jgi:DNA-directed RNA polymerase subunit RPC12/RpoP
MMSEEPKKKMIMIKKKGAPAKSPIKLNPPKEDMPPATEETPPKQIKLQPAAKPAAAEAPKPAAKPEPAATQATPEIFKFYCVYCGQKLSASVDMVGKTITCPACKHKIQIPPAP